MFGKSEKNKRFTVTYSDKGLSGCRIIVDNETGVNYLYSWDGYSGGLTTLLNENGEPVITKVDK